MFHIALTPSVSPSNAFRASAPTLIGAIGELYRNLAILEFEDWVAAKILEATKEAVDCLENDEPAKGIWSDMGCEDDAFSIDIFCADDARFVKLNDDLLLVPHGAIGLGIAPLNVQEWIYDEDDLAHWDEVLYPHVAYHPEAEAKLSEPITIDSHNEPLRQAMFARGCKWKDNGQTQHFTLNGRYEPYPIGYIRGPHYSNNGNPKPYTFSVQGPDGWLQMHFNSTEVSVDGVRWALSKAAEVLTKATAPAPEGWGSVEA